MKEMYLNYKKDLSNKNKIILVVVIIFLIGLIFGSFYITILNTNEKTLIIKKVTNFFSNNKITFSNKILLFKNSLVSNLIYFFCLWFLGISVIGVPLILIMIFFKGFVTGFSIGSIFACYKLKGIIGILLYIFPNIIVLSVFSIFLGTYSLNLSINLLNYAFKKKTLNFGSFMGKYFFIALITILLCILCAAFDGFINPHILNLFTNLSK